MRAAISALAFSIACLASWPNEWTLEGLPKCFGEIGQHLVNHPGVGWRCCRVIEIYLFHTYPLQWSHRLGTPGDRPRVTSIGSIKLPSVSTS